MGVPRFGAADVPFREGAGAIVEALEVAGATVTISALSLGNPHAVQVVADLDAAPVATAGAADRDARAFSAAGQRRLHAGRRSR